MANHSVPRRATGTINHQFQVVFFERIYSGAPRWWSNEWKDHFRRPSGGGGYCMERESEVKKHLQLSHNPKLMFNQDVPYLLACTYFNCKFRTWESVSSHGTKLASVRSEKDFGMNDDLEKEERTDFSNRIEAELYRVSLA